MTKINWNQIEKKQRELIQILHGELGWFNTEELENTPKRITRFYQEFINNKDYSFTVFKAPMTSDQSLIVLKNITLNSLCSHHLMNFRGYCHISYYPKSGGKICGVSKLVRLVRHHASRPQVQEELTQIIADELMTKLDASFCMVYISATHSCMVARGVKEHQSRMITSAIRWNKSDQFINTVFEAMKQESLDIFLSNGD